MGADSALGTGELRAVAAAKERCTVCVGRVVSGAVGKLGRAASLESTGRTPADWCGQDVEAEREGTLFFLDPSWVLLTCSV